MPPCVTPLLVSYSCLLILGVGRMLKTYCVLWLWICQSVCSACAIVIWVGLQAEMSKKGKVSKLFSVELIPLLGFSSGERLQKKWKWRKIISYLPQFSFPSQFCIWSGKALTTLIEFWRLNFPFCTFKPLFKFQGHSQCQNLKLFISGCGCVNSN